MLDMFDQVDPFLMQLVIVPFFVIGIGVLSSIVSKIVFVGPIVTFILNFLYNFWYFNHFYPDTETNINALFSWGIIFPLITLVISWLLLANKNQPNKWIRYLKYIVLVVLILLVGMTFFRFIIGYFSTMVS